MWRHKYIDKSSWQLQHSTFERKWSVFQEEHCSMVIAKRCGFSFKSVKAGVLLKSSISHHGIVKCFSPFWNPVRALTYWEQPCREGHRSTGGSEAEHEPALWTHSPESQVYSGLQQKKRGQQLEGSDPPPQLVPQEIPHWSTVSSPGALSTSRTEMCSSRSRVEPWR